MTRVVATVEARMTSSRLPGKVLLDAAGRPLLEHLVERLRRCALVDDVVVATTVDAASDPIVELADRLGVRCHRGSEDDVLQRVLDAAVGAAADVIVETTGDCPLIDPAVVDAVVRRYARGDVDYCSNTLERTFPRGMDVQVFSTDVLRDVAARTADPVDHEHVSLFIYEHPELYRLAGVTSADPAWAQHRLTVDTAEDYALVRTVFERLLPTAPDFGLADVLALLASDPALAALNRGVVQKPVR